MSAHMTFREQCDAAKAQTHWTARQRNHLRRLMKRADESGDVVFAYWLSNAFGRPANHPIDNLADRRRWTARPGLVQTVPGPLASCSGRALHATLEPHRWQGCRAWLVALVGEVERTDGKVAALRREIIGEIAPEEATTPSVGVKIGRRDLVGANLGGANLGGANLGGAYLDSANLDGANLDGAHLARADLRGAHLARADLTGANLTGADLTGANLDGAHLTGADLTGADLTGADLTGANLAYANLRGADLTGANLDGAHLTGANLAYAHLGGCYWPKSRPAPDGWTHDPPRADVSYVVLRRV